MENKSLAPWQQYWFDRFNELIKKVNTFDPPNLPAAMEFIEQAVDEKLKEVS